MIKRFVYVALAFCAVGFLYAEDRMRAGLWAITTTMDGKPASETHNTCFTAAMVELGNSSGNTLRENTERTLAKRHCTLKDFKMEGHTISMTSVCAGSSLSTTSTYALDAFTTDSISTNGATKTTVQMKGRRLGDCK